MIINKYNNLPIILSIITSIYIGGITTCLIGKMSPCVFGVYVLLIYLCVIPKGLLSPINMITAIYFVFYFLSPAYATRYEHYNWENIIFIKAYFMIFTTFVVSVSYLHYLEKKQKINNHLENFRFYMVNYKTLALVMLIISLCFLLLYVQHTGGINAWIYDSKMAFISRVGAGKYYLGFLLSLYIYSMAMGLIIYMNKSIAVFMLHLLIIFILFIFVGSKANIIKLIFLSISVFLISKKTLSKWTLVMTLTIVLITLIGLYQRNISWMTWDKIIPYIFNYFDTLEQFGVLLRDMNANIMKSFFMPLNFVLLKLGFYVHQPFKDLSVWLTSVYYPTIHELGATTQWPIEADLYLNFFYFGGIPFLLIYLKILNWLYFKAQQKNPAFICIYIIEFANISSHYRGGILIWWYWYLIPFYCIVYYLFKKYNIKYTISETEITKCHKSY